MDGEEVLKRLEGRQKKFEKLAKDNAKKLQSKAAAKKPAAKQPPRKAPRTKKPVS